MHDFTPFIPINIWTQVGPLQLSKRLGVQVGGALMAIGLWPPGCPGLVEGSWVIWTWRMKGARMKVQQHGA